MPLRHGIPHGDIVKSYIGLLCQGKSDFEAMSQFVEDDFFRQALGIGRAPSVASLRQRMDDGALAWLPVIESCSVDFMVKANVPVTPLASGHIAIDMDVYPMDNSGTKKGGVSRAYKGYDGYAPIAAYMGRGRLVYWNGIREGKQHSQKGFVPFLKTVLSQARRLSADPCLVRLDSAHDALESRVTLVEEGADYILKWNPRTSDFTQ